MIGLVAGFREPIEQAYESQLVSESQAVVFAPALLDVFEIFGGELGLLDELFVGVGGAVSYFEEKERFYDKKT